MIQQPILHVNKTQFPAIQVNAHSAILHSLLYRKLVYEMPQVRVRRSNRNINPIKSVEAFRKPIADVQSLLNRIMAYEETARECGFDYTASRFKMLTTSEQEYLRAELVADLIRLSAANTGRTPVFFDTSLMGFCSKICDLGLPTTELLGTYLAAQEIAREDLLKKKISGFDNLLNKTMQAAMQTCADMLTNKTNSSILINKRVIKSDIPEAGI